MQSLIAIFALTGVPAEDEFASAAKILSQHCVRCHNVDKARGGLDLSSRASALLGGATRVALVPGRPEESSLLERARDGSMPPAKDGRRLTPEEVEVLRRWVRQGAPWPEQQPLPVDATAVGRVASPGPGVLPRRRFWRWRNR